MLRLGDEERRMIVSLPPLAAPLPRLEAEMRRLFIAMRRLHSYHCTAFQRSVKAFFIYAAASYPSAIIAEWEEAAAKVKKAAMAKQEADPMAKRGHAKA